MSLHLLVINRPLPARQTHLVDYFVAVVVVVVGGGGDRKHSDRITTSTWTRLWACRDLFPLSWGAVTSLNSGWMRNRPLIHSRVWVPLRGRKQVGQTANVGTQPTQCSYSTSCLVNLRSLSPRWIKWCLTAQHGVNIWYILSHLEVTFIFAVTRKKRETSVHRGRCYT